MGGGFFFACPGCNYQLEVTLDIGFAYSSLENVIDRVHPKRRPKVIEVLKSHDVEACDYAHALYRCGNCAGLYGRFYVRIEYDGGKVYESVFKCPRCRAILERLPDDVEPPPLRCPSCGRRNLEVSWGPLWD